VTISLVTVYDMAKAMDRGMTIGEVCLMAKTGGQGGEYSRA
jgi:cyclic pyranopterin monophosphate synthase